MGSWVKEIFLWFILTPQIILYSPKRYQKWEMTYRMHIPWRKVRLSFLAQLIHKSQAIVEELQACFSKSPWWSLLSRWCLHREREQCHPEEKKDNPTYWNICQCYWIQLLSTELVGWIIPGRCLFLFSILFFESTFFLSILWVSSYD